MKFVLTTVLALLIGMELTAAQTPPPTVAPADEAVTHGPPATLKQAPLVLTSAQKAIIQENVKRDSSKRASPVKFTAEVGAEVPPSLELYILPDRALSEVPQAKLVKYTVVDNKIVLVDPTNMRVVDVIDM